MVDGNNRSITLNNNNCLSITLLNLILIMFTNNTDAKGLYSCRNVDGNVSIQDKRCQNTDVETVILFDSENQQDNNKFSGERVTFNFIDMPVVNALSLLAEFAGNKIYFEPSAVHLATAHFDFIYKNRPWDELLYKILEQSGLQLSYGDKIWIIRSLNTQ